MKIYGRNAVEEALKAGTTIDRLVVQKDMKDAGANRIIKEAKDRGIKIFFREKTALDRECDGKSRHQGFIAEVTDFRYCELSDILAYAEEKGEPPFVVLLDGVEDPHNLGSVLRVAECAGVHGVVIPRHRAVSVNDTVVKSARNIPGVVTSPAKLINVYDLLNAKTLVIDKDALAVIEEVFA